MNLTDFRGMAALLMYEHGLNDWSINFDRAKRRAGVCFHSTKTLSFSAELMFAFPESEARDTVLHEIAHALVGPSHGHDFVWRRKAIEIGCSGARCVSSDAPKAKPNWVGTCPNGHRVNRYRKSKSMDKQSCARCSSVYDSRYKLQWQRV